MISTRAVVSAWLADDPATAANIKRAGRIRKSWPATAMGLGLVHRDRAPSLAERWNGHREAPKPRIRVPEIMHLSADPYGVTMIVSTVRGVGRESFSKVSGSLADEWRMRMVQCEALDDDPQWGPGFVRVRAVHVDTLTLDVQQPVPMRLTDLTRVELGLDRMGEPVCLPLAQGSTVTVTGASGFGKSMFARNVVVKLAPSPNVQFVGANGKAVTSLRGDYRVLAPRYSHLVAGDPGEVNELLTGLQAEMYRRLDVMYDEYGVDEYWDIPGGPPLDMPVIFGTMDECQTYLTGGQRGSERAAIIADNAEIGEDLTKKARAAGLVILWMTQKGTHDAIPTAIRDVATSTLTFPVRSRAQEVAALGEEIRDFPEMSPRKILKRSYRGVGTIGLEGGEGFVQFKTPLTPPGLAEAVCRATAHYVRDVPGIAVGRDHRMSAPSDLSGLTDAPPAPRPGRAGTDRPHQGTGHPGGHRAARRPGPDN
jgi:S-DNA-T family DNA segregation ATPase FtsK/SpoIIIE